MYTEIVLPALIWQFRADQMPESHSRPAPERSVGILATEVSGRLKPRLGGTAFLQASEQEGGASWPHCQPDPFGSGLYANKEPVGGFSNFCLINPILQPAIESLMSALVALAAAQ